MMTTTINSLRTAALLLLSAAAAPQTAIALSTITQQPKPPITTTKDRPLLRQFGRGINERILNSKEGYNYETIPCLDMQTTSDSDTTNNNVAASSSLYDVSSQREIREAYMANDNTQQGCCIIRLTGKDATSVRGLVDFADNFFEGVDSGDNESDNDDSNGATSIAARRLKDLGVFRIANNVHAGFDHNVNEEGKMQVLYTKLIPGDDDEDPLLLPLEVGDLVGTKSLSGAHSGMSTLFDIGSQITSAVLGMDTESTNKLLDDCSRTTAKVEMISDNHEQIADTMSNSYQRIIRYLKPKQDEDAQNDAAFWPHGWKFGVLRHGMLRVMSWRNEGTLSDGQVPTCIHRVIAPKPPSPSAFGFGTSNNKYKPRVSAPLFLRPRRGDEAVLDVESDLRDSDNTGLYFEKGLMEECDEMRVWDYMDCMSPNN
ncbi:hypothetical protein QTG54_009628 [Skeletonema marinoi]|uniref:Isopenicillin N synthase-like Fe(2+) 2OG dioxygenase domain-containing protein n=1 Tax=Skeletonema marinoi TaxID=267567 RepID=A0AAD8Y537_9STRA|nr:hypothetical protein QTG54_009628 [Skeletonema marinoi]